MGSFSIYHSSDEFNGTPTPGTSKRSIRKICDFMLNTGLEVQSHLLPLGDAEISSRVKCQNLTLHHSVCKQR